MTELFSGAYSGATVLLTGHTGFKGSWMGEWLLSLGAKVIGFSNGVAERPNHFSQIKLGNRLDHLVGDVRDLDTVRKAISSAKPDYVFHLAAQSLVRYSYEHPVETMATNIMGTVNVLEALRELGRSAACVVVTSDKCYANREMLSGYREDDPMGGRDPYSASKGAAEIVAQSYRKSFFTGKNAKIRVATARAGNVIGGGDWSVDRIVPDCARSLIRREAIEVRNPRATRPWQHVLESLSGYMWLGALLAGAATTTLIKEPEHASESFNFGPWPDGHHTVERLVQEFLKNWPGSWVCAGGTETKHEARLLGLSVDKAFHKLEWAPVFNFEDAVEVTANWYRRTATEKRDPLSQTQDDIARYVAAAQRRGVPWAA